jgi:hypothetical protein
VESAVVPVTDEQGVGRHASRVSTEIVPGVLAAYVVARGPRSCRAGSWWPITRRRCTLSERHVRRCRH